MDNPSTTKKRRVIEYCKSVLAVLLCSRQYSTPNTAFARLRNPRTEKRITQYGYSKLRSPETGDYGKHSGRPSAFRPAKGGDSSLKKPGSFVAGGIKLDIRRLNPADVIGIALSPERQEQQNVRKLKGLDQRSWEHLVNLIDQGGNQTPLDAISKLLGLESRSQEVEALAARGNMTSIVRTLHDKGSQLLDMLIYALSQGKLCIIDVSQMRGAQALMLSGLILRRETLPYLIARTLLRAHVCAFRPNK